MMKDLVSLMITAVFFLTGCSSVEMSQPLPPETAPVDQQNFEGTWKLNDQIVSARFTKDGALHFAGVEWENGDFAMSGGKALITKGKDHNYLSLQMNSNEEKQESYTFVQYRFTSGGHLVLWGPRVPAFVSAVEKGLLKGTVEKQENATTVTLSSPPCEVLEFLENTESHKLFNYDNPGVLTRVAVSN